MCELLGFSGKHPADIREYLRTFYAHSVRHPHGWGIMYEDAGRQVYREGIRAADSIVLPELLRAMPDQQHLLAHIRFATVGAVSEVNCHPFTGRDLTGREWTLIHNGTIYSGRKLIRSMYRQAGDTDSERLFLYLLHCVNVRQGTQPLSASERFALVDAFVQEMSPRNKLNLLIWDGELLYIHKNLKNTLVYKHLPEGTLFSTQPLTDAPGWEKVPLAQLIAYRDGEQVFTGTEHRGQFIPTLEYITAMDAMHI